VQGVVRGVCGRTLARKVRGGERSRARSKEVVNWNVFVVIECSVHGETTMAGRVSLLMLRSRAQFRPDTAAVWRCACE